ncbi:TOBE domain-containing protein [Malaciobacter mytili]|uniref:Transporter n=1 Tax=Malaciobacter mytili LMG 24559 TaxID=1032238 RepID=A0AAX2AHB9_9BACT|nr:TOBE domain-containing protein [Malaciobacter mytili]AXH14935.1 molybdenum-pterin binding domain-containing protein [Malaciobacter mytili LMG 24559]RXI43706.1 transporter [Malaciobacter mytili]RXK14851.1 transporter [Malaciobacter mytili LMG 24559]
MNELKVVVSKIQSLENLNIVEFLFEDITLSMMSLDLDNIKENDKVLLTVKASNIAIAKEFQGQISLANSINAKIIQFDRGELLTSIKLNAKGTTLSSIITTKSAKRMDLKLGDDVAAIFKSSDLSIKKVL